MDCFANYYNCKLPKFFSRYWNPGEMFKYCLEEPGYDSSLMVFTALELEAQQL